MNDWSPDVEGTLENIRINSLTFYQHHRERYYYYKSYLKYFKLPLIVLSSITSIASVGLTHYLPQRDISLMTCLLSLSSAIIASVEMYLGIEKSMGQEQDASRAFQLLAYDIFRTLSLTPEHRGVNGKRFLDDKYNEYAKLVEVAEMARIRHLNDALAPIPEQFKLSTPEHSSSNFGLEMP